MNRKTWNWIYLIGFLLPVVFYVLSHVYITSGGVHHILFDGSIGSSINWFVDSVNLMPVCKVGALIYQDEFSVLADEMPLLSSWLVGADFVIWLSIVHIVIDLFMLLSRVLSKLFNKFGGAD